PATWPAARRHSPGWRGNWTGSPGPWGSSATRRRPGRGRAPETWGRLVAPGGRAAPNSARPTKHAQQSAGSAAGASREAAVMAKVLIVDDSAFDRQRAGKLLELQPGVPALEFAGELQAVYASDGNEALTVLEREKPDVVVTDMQMPGMDGL